MPRERQKEGDQIAGCLYSRVIFLSILRSISLLNKSAKAPAPKQLHCVLLQIRMNPEVGLSASETSIKAKG